MNYALGAVRRKLFAIDPRQATFACRGFRSSDESARHHLERVGATFLIGYHAAIEEDRPERLDARLETVDTPLRGFAFEGAAMGVSLRDLLAPWSKSRLPRLLAGPGSAHIYMIHVGVGWAWARVPWTRHTLNRCLAKLDPLLRWLAFDGYGFHEAYFRPTRSIVQQATPTFHRGYARRAFDQGLGRGLWFVDGADVERIPTTISHFPSSRHADLWAGVGLACAYAGITNADALKSLRSSAGSFRPQLAQGAAFAAKARQRAQNMAPHTELACEALCGLSSTEAAQVTDDALVNLPGDGELPSFEIWRQRIQALLTRELATR